MTLAKCFSILFSASEPHTKDVENGLRTKYMRGAFYKSEYCNGLTLIGVQRIMGSRHTFFAFPLSQDLLFVENQGIAVAVQHGLGAIYY